MVQQLSSLSAGASGRVVSLSLDDGDGRWLRAVGLFEGQRVVVLRRGWFGGPLHVQIGAGAELAIDRGLASRVGVDVAEGCAEAAE